LTRPAFLAVIRDVSPPLGGPNDADCTKAGELACKPLQRKPELSDNENEWRTANVITHVSVREITRNCVPGTTPHAAVRLDDDDVTDDAEPLSAGLDQRIIPKARPAATDLTIALGTRVTTSL
jgi:hypothetical protein